MTYCNSFAPVVVTGAVKRMEQGCRFNYAWSYYPADATYAVMEYRAGSGTIYRTGKFGNGVTTTYAAAGNAQIIKFI